MVSFIIVSKNSTMGMAQINEQCDNLHISPFDRIVLSKDSLEKTTAQSIGIAEIKLLQKKIYLKPMQGTDKAIIIQNGEILTNEAQNALLKVLEEPPAHTYIYILTETLNALLPTIISRCKVIQLDSPKNITRDSTDTITNFLYDLPSMSLGNKLHVAEIQGKQKQAAIDWLEEMLPVTRNLLSTLVQEERAGQIPFYIHFSKQIQKTHDIIQSTNVSVRLALEYMLLSI